ncbi:hypothetical protein DM02DRAFT_18259 [Periconia macrospinosa]|uniref:Uncharacterized protein n=1 Tax=Periconia macrospinosa TaxID=97972 RepID=A0A2V1E8G4_9PLEO|nr:hypothetical protein DM02DRAFT_18259 [Periconia macrospinosa]
MHTAKEADIFIKPALPETTSIQRQPETSQMPIETSNHIYTCDLFPVLTPTFYSTELPFISRPLSPTTPPTEQPILLPAPVIRSILTYYFDDFFSNEWNEGDRPVNDQDFSENKTTGDYPITDLVLYNREYRPFLNRLTRFKDPNIREAIREAFWTICGSRSAIFLCRRNNLFARPWAYPPRPYARFVTRMNIVIQVQDMDEQGIKEREPPTSRPWYESRVEKKQGDLRFLQRLFGGGYGLYSSLKHIGLDVRSEGKLWVWYLVDSVGISLLTRIREGIWRLVTLARERIPLLRSFEIQGFPWNIDGFRDEVRKEARNRVQFAPGASAQSDWHRITKWTWKIVWVVPEDDETGKLIYWRFSPLTTVDANIGQHESLERPYHDLWMESKPNERKVPRPNLLLGK